MNADVSPDLKRSLRLENVLNQEYQWLLNKEEWSKIANNWRRSNRFNFVDGNMLRVSDMSEQDIFQEISDIVSDKFTYKLVKNRKNNVLDGRRITDGNKIVQTEPIRDLNDSNYVLQTFIESPLNFGEEKKLLVTGIWFDLSKGYRAVPLGIKDSIPLEYTTQGYLPLDLIPRRFISKEEMYTRMAATFPLHSKMKNIYIVVYDELLVPQEVR